MENNSNIKKILIIFTVILLIAVGFLLYDKARQKDKYLNTINKLENQVRTLEKENKLLKRKENTSEIKLKDLYGSYVWNKKVDQFDLKISLSLKEDGIAVYETSTGKETEKTYGNYVYDNGKIIYTKEYYSDNGITQQENKKAYSGDDKVITFIVKDRNTLQNTFYNQKTSLKNVTAHIEVSS